MPFDSNGVFSLVPGYLAVTGQTVLASQHNPPLEDIAASGLSQTFLRNGLAPMTGNLNFNTFKGINLANGTLPGDAVNYSQLSTVDPLGIPKPYLGTTAPTGYVFCFGQAISRTTFAALFAVLGVSFGAGDGSTTFNLPDLRGMVLAGRDNMGGAAAGRITIMGGTTLGAGGGGETVVLAVPNMPAHSHGGLSGAAGSHVHSMQAFAGTNGGSGAGIQIAEVINNENPTSRISTNGAPNHQHSIPSEGSGAPLANLQPTIIVNYILRTGV